MSSPFRIEAAVSGPTKGLWDLCRDLNPDLTNGDVFTMLMGLWLSHSLALDQAYTDLQRDRLRERHRNLTFTQRHLSKAMRFPGRQDLAPLEEDYEIEFRTPAPTA